MHACMYLYVHIYTCMHACVPKCAYICTHACVPKCVCTHAVTYIHACVPKCVCTYAFMHVFLRVFVHMHSCMCS